MAKFKKGLNDEFIKLLNEAYNKGGWWRDILNDSDLHIGIRNDYLNIYYAGNSLIKLEQKHDQLLGRTHYKFLLDPYKNLYVKSYDGEPNLYESSDEKANHDDKDLKKLFINNFNKLKEIKRASLYYAGEEKKGIQKILMSNQNIIDVEIALTDEGAKESSEELPDVERKRSRAPRIDFAALQKSDKGWELVFFEAKLFSNPEIRATKNNKPKIVEQITTYERLIKGKLEDIKKSYINVCKNLLDLEGEILKKKKAIVEEVARQKNLTISPRPRLIIFGFDDDQKKGRLANDKERLLRHGLIEDQIYLRGKPNGFNLGISS
ncbi:MAG: hypothetical protein WCB64_04710 [Desulfobaccales bacterium]